MARDITPRQKKFVQEYLRSGDATDAAIAAGYSAKSAASTASKTLKMPGVIEYRRELEKKLFDEMGISKAWIGRRLVEIVELPEHPWYVGCQFHPEFKSRPDRPHPLFTGFVAAALRKAGK